VTDPGAFAKVCNLARAAAEEDRIVMFGVEPTRPATEYGYIRPGPSIGPGLFAIERFVEKPDAETAERYLEQIPVDFTHSLHA
jgi:mannose-1-phosphate guanylyltransferase